VTNNGRSGVAHGVGAYVWWGLFPGFFPLLLPAGSLEVLAHRFVWTAVFLVVVLIIARRLRDLRRLSGRTWLLLAAASALIAINWGTYIFAVTHSHVVDTALGYFINPLISVALGVFVLRERIRRLQLVALAIAVVAVAVLTAHDGGPPVDRASAGHVVRVVRSGEEGGDRRSASERRGGVAVGAAVRRGLSDRVGGPR
jgi:chloramphenicol-sensitive protein RarD